MSKKQFINNIWQFTWSKWIIYLTVFITPLYASTSHWYPFTTPKTLIIIGGTLLAGIFFTWGLIENKQETVKITALHWVLLAFLLVMSVAGIFGIDPTTSFFGTFFSSVGIVLLVVLGMLACIISEFIRRDFAFVKYVLTATFISGVVVAFIAYLPLIGGFKWPLLGPLLELSAGGATGAGGISGGSMIGNSSFAGTFLLFAIGFGGYLLLTTEGWKKKLLHALGILVILACPPWEGSNI